MHYYLEPVYSLLKICFILVKKINCQHVDNVVE